jgi:hypothetical protein
MCTAGQAKLIDPLLHFIPSNLRRLSIPGIRQTIPSGPPLPMIIIVLFYTGHGMNANNPTGVFSTPPQLAKELKRTDASWIVFVNLLTSAAIPGG